MKRDDLARLFQRMDVNPDAVCIFGVPDDEQYVLSRRRFSFRKRYVAYYLERGHRNRERAFSTEEEACDYFAEHVLRDPTTRLGYPVFPADEAGI